MPNPPFSITVNDHTVPWVHNGRRAFGAEIKAAAIAAGIDIAPDFLLSMETRRGTFTQIDDDEMLKVTHSAVFVAVTPNFRILVNNNPVQWPKRDRRATGLEIKAAAIAAGVEIELDFLLSVKNRRGIFDPVGDDEVVKLDDCETFRAVGSDDNS